VPRSVKKTDLPQEGKPVRKRAAAVKAVKEVKAPEIPAVQEEIVRPAGDVTLNASRRFWLLILAGVFVVLGVIQGYGYLTGWGNPERVIQRRFDVAQRLTLAKRYDAAIREYEKIIKSKTGDDNIRQAMIGTADLLREREEWDRAIEFYGRLRLQDSHNVLAAWAGLQIGDIQREAGKLDNALQSYDEVSRLFPKSDWDAEARLGSGKVFEKQGKFAEAIAGYEQLVKEYGGGFLAAEALVHIGQCHELQGNPAAARKAYRTVLDQYPSSTWDDAKSHLKRLDAGQEAEGIRVWGKGDSSPYRSAGGRSFA